MFVVELRTKTFNKEFNFKFLPDLPSMPYIIVCIHKLHVGYIFTVALTVKNGGSSSEQEVNA